MSNGVSRWVGAARAGLLALVAMGWLGLGACSPSPTRTSPGDADGGQLGHGPDAGSPDGGTIDGGSLPDGGGVPDGGVPDGGVPDGGTTDGGTVDGGSPDGGSPDGGSPDGGSGFQLGTPGPWPTGNVAYGRADGIQESPVVGASADEDQNRWVATHDALYLLQPGQTTFRRFDARDGLHLPSNPVIYHETYWLRETIAGGAVPPGITELTGGGRGEVFVGYQGDDEGMGDYNDPGRHSGKIDRVRLLASGALQVDRFDLASIDHGMVYWHDRTIERLIYDHWIHPHTLYAGTNHGVVLLLPDAFRLPNPGEWIDSVNKEWMGDHLHAQVCWHKACTDESGLRLGDWRGLAIAKDGGLWLAGKWTAGKITWHPDPSVWVSRNGAAFAVAFGDPYAQPGLPSSPPVFMPPNEGDAVNMTAVAEAPDGTVWFASRSWGCGNVDCRGYGVATWKPHRGFIYLDPVRDLGMAEEDVADLVALPDGRLVLAGPNTGLVFYDPATGQKKPLRAGQGIPSDRVQRLELDTMTDPPTLYVSTAGGAAALRILP
jgi:hypothetical protein